VACGSAWRVSKATAIAVTAQTPLENLPLLDCNFSATVYPVPLNDVGEVNSSQLLIIWSHQHLFIYSLILTINRSFSVPCLCSNCSVFFAWMDCDFRRHRSNL